MPIGIVYDGDDRAGRPGERPNVFRIAPTNHGMAFRLAEYLVPKRLKIAFLTDDTGYGRAGRTDRSTMRSRRTRSRWSTRIQIPSTATDLAPQVLQARRAARDRAARLGAARRRSPRRVIAARSVGWKVPIYTSPAGEDPLVRQELAGHPSWVDGLTFASGRMTAEKGPGPVPVLPGRATRSRSARSRSGSRRSRGPSGHAAARLCDVPLRLRPARSRPHSGRRGRRTADAVTSALDQVSIEGANGDHRGFNETNHEGVVDDDVYFARFADMTYAPVKDDALSATLPTIPQEG